MRLIAWLSAMALCGLFACGDDDSAPRDAAMMDSGMEPTDSGPQEDAAQEDSGQDAGPQDAGNIEDSSTEDGGNTVSGWELHAHPCVGNRTDTLWVDDDGASFVGCGSTTDGDQGLYMSRDGGASWDAPQTTPNGFLETWRVHDISRSSDGLLYIAGRNTTGGERVVRADTSSIPWVLEAVYEPPGTVAFSFEVGGFRRASNGRAVAESSTGTGIVYRDSDDDDWQDGSAWDDMFSGLQLLQLVEHEGAFYGCGSTISAPPRLYVPPADNGWFGFDVIQLSSDGLGNFDGEMWGLDVDASGIVVAGVDQGRDVGMVYVTELDGTEVASLDVSTIHADDSTWMRGACRRGDTLIAVGEFSRRGAGLILRSDDNGESWSDVTPESLPSVHRCKVLEDGSVYVAGANGTFAVHAP